MEICFGFGIASDDESQEPLALEPYPKGLIGSNHPPARSSGTPLGGAVPALIAFRVQLEPLP